MTVERLTNSNLDIIVSMLRTQIDALEKLQKSIEEEHAVGNYAHESVKRVEKNLRWLRKLFFNN